MVTAFNHGNDVILLGSVSIEFVIEARPSSAARFRQQICKKGDDDGDDLSVSKEE